MLIITPAVIIRGFSQEQSILKNGMKCNNEYISRKEDSAVK
ncbi:Uncharacterised protein [Escherichia coli]|uniref:Uncharacterized protein n=1 Tax=Escherichia coli TaxID=562 RepID=A0A376L0A9_ECOLX|nr:Uncharacterised protein [Escherichia coli]